MISIPLTKGYVAIVDDEDVGLARFKWHALEQRLRDGSIKTVYAIRDIRLPDGRRTTQRLHCAILPVPAGVEVDHADRDGLNCRRSNLRPATRDQNHANRSSRKTLTGLKGVRWHVRDRRWEARIQAFGRRTHLGSFTVREDAGRAYDAAAFKLFGEFAYLNFPDRLLGGEEGGR